MAAIDDLFSSIGGWLRAAVELGFSIALVLLVVNVLFGAGPDIVGSLADFVESFTDRGVVGLIVFLFILSIYKS